MASIRIVDVWLRSPVSQPTAWRSVMIIADAWAEQRVLMRAYASSADQTRPTIVLHGAELAIGPASAEPNGPWGIHVEPASDGRAQELREQLQLAAKRLAGSKGTPPRLADEAPAFERKRTNNWSPGTPPDIGDGQHPVAASSGASSSQNGPGGAYFEPALAASQAQMAYASAAGHAHTPGQAPAAFPIGPSAPTVMPHMLAATPPAVAAPRGVSPVPPALSVTPVPSPYPDQRLTPIRVTSDSSPPPHAEGDRRGWTSPVKVAAPAVDRPVGATTAMGFASGAGAQTAAARLGLPAALDLTAAERDVLNALGQATWLTAQRIRALVGVADPVAWMEQLIVKLAAQGLELVTPGEPRGGEPTYKLKR